MANSRGAVRVVVGIIVAIVVLFVVAVVALPALVNANQYHDKIQAELQSKIGRPVKLGDISLHIIPLSLRVNDVEIGEDPNFHTGKPFATAKQLDVSAKLMPLLHHDLQVDSLELMNPAIELVRDNRGTWNFASLGNANAATNADANARTAPPTPASPSSAQQKHSASPGGGNFDLSHLRLADGAVAVTDQTQGNAKRQVYDHIDAQVDGFAPDKNFTFKLTAHMPGAASHTINVDGNAGPINSSNMQSTPVDAKVTMNGVEVGEFQKFMASSSSSTTIGGLLSGDVHVKSNGPFQADGNLRLDKATANGNPLGFPIATDFHMTGDATSQQYHVAGSKVQLGDTPFPVEGEINAKPTPALADLRLSAKNASLAELGKIMSGMGVAFPQGSQVAGTLDGVLNAKGALERPMLNGNLIARNVKVSGGSVTQPIDAQSVQIAAQNLNFNSAAANVIPTLNGGLNLNIQGANIGNLDMIKQFASLAQSTFPGHNLTKIIQTTGGFAVRNGIAHTDNLKAVLDGATVAAIGDVNLASQAINARVTAVLTKAMTQQVGGTSLGGMMSSALANSDGELVVPALVTGTLSSPRFSVDMQQMAQMRLKHLLPTTANPAAAAGLLGALSGGANPNAQGGALGGVLGALGGQKQQTAQPAQQQQKPANPLKGILGGLTGKH